MGISHKELRIGNLILVNGVIQEVCELPLPENCTNKNTSGIPLTEEWLLLFNLLEVSGKLIFNGKEIKKGVFFSYLNGKVLIQNTKTTLFIVDKIKYVHQLQNLYFALTGEELTLKK